VRWRIGEGIDDRLSCSMTGPSQPCVTINGSAFLWREPDVNEVNVDPVDRRRELRQGIQLHFGLAAPVVANRPVTSACAWQQLGALRG
jgi:hypothetical protein